jgi:hypothetical protein
MVFLCVYGLMIDLRSAFVITGFLAIAPSYFCLIASIRLNFKSTDARSVLVVSLEGINTLLPLSTAYKSDTTSTGTSFFADSA